MQAEAAILPEMIPPINYLIVVAIEGLTSQIKVSVSLPILNLLSFTDWIQELKFRFTNRSCQEEE